jgi:hypothetical protein
VQSFVEEQPVIMQPVVEEQPLSCNLSKWLRHLLTMGMGTGVTTINGIIGITITTIITTPITDRSNKQS